MGRRTLGQGAFEKRPKKWGGRHAELPRPHPPRGTSQASPPSLTLLSFPRLNPGVFSLSCRPHAPTLWEVSPSLKVLSTIRTQVSPQFTLGFGNTPASWAQDPLPALRPSELFQATRPGTGSAPFLGNLQSSRVPWLRASPVCVSVFLSVWNHKNTPVLSNDG